MIFSIRVILRVLCIGFTVHFTYQNHSNRTSTIQSLTNGSKDMWYHIRSDENPADLLSRVITFEDLVNRGVSMANFWYIPEITFYFRSFVNKE